MVYTNTLKDKHLQKNVQAPCEALGTETEEEID